MDTTSNLILHWNYLAKKTLKKYWIEHYPAHANHRKKTLVGDPEWIDAGDGGFLLIQGPESNVIEIVGVFFGIINRGNDSRSDDAKLYLRCAIHKDRVLPWNGNFGKKYTGNGLNHCARLLDGMNKEQNGQVICSKKFRSALSAFGEEVVEMIRLKEIIDKHNTRHEVWNIMRLPGIGVEPRKIDLHSNPYSR